MDKETRKTLNELRMLYDAYISKVRELVSILDQIRNLLHALGDYPNADKAEEAITRLMNSLAETLYKTSIPKAHG